MHLCYIYFTHTKTISSLSTVPTYWKDDTLLLNSLKQIAIFVYRFNKRKYWEKNKQKIHFSLFWKRRKVCAGIKKKKRKKKSILIFSFVIILIFLFLLSIMILSNYVHWKYSKCVLVWKWNEKLNTNIIKLRGIYLHTTIVDCFCVLFFFFWENNKIKSSTSAMLFL